MNKALHALVYVFLIITGAALFFEIQLNGKRAELTDRNRMQEDYLVKIAKTIENEEPDKSATFEVQKDASPVEAKIVDVPDMANLLEEYNAPLEQANLKTYNWDSQNVREQLRSVYVRDPEGNPVMDGNEPLKRGPGTEDELLNKLFESCKAQQTRLNTTRAALSELRAKLKEAADELNKLKPVARQDKVEVVQEKEKVTKLEGEKAELENQITKVKGQVDELNTEITSLKDEVQTAKDDRDQAKEDLEKMTKERDDYRSKYLKTQLTEGQRAEKSSVTQLVAGNKGEVIMVDNENMFAIVKFTDEAMKELKGDNLANPIPQIECGLRRKGYKGPAGEFVGRIRLRQEVKGKNYVICDVLGDWEQDHVKVGDVVFAD